MERKLASAVGIGAGVAVTVVTLRFLRRFFQGSSGSSQLSNGNSPASRDGSGECDPADEKTVWVYFGSQSGTAEGFSNELEQEAPGHDVKIVVEDLENFEPTKFEKHKVVLLLLATYGEGDPTDNAVEFFKWMCDESLPEDTLKDVKFSVMGLGNRQYVNFNSCGKLADKHMERLGAQRIHDLGLGDDDQNIEEDFEQWKESGLWPALKAALGQSNATEASKANNAVLTADEVKDKLPLRVTVGSEKDMKTDPLVQVGGADILGKWYFGASIAPIVESRELRQVRDEEAGKTTKHIEFCTKHLPALQWKTADNLEILPRNPEDVVLWFAERLGVQDQLESSCSFIRAPGWDKAVRKPFPTPCTVRLALELYCDLCAAPSRSVAKRLAAFVTDTEDRAALTDLLADLEDYQWLTGEGVHMSLREFFELWMPSADIDLGSFFQICPRQKSRPYTIASSSRADPNRIGVCVSMVQESSLPSLAQIVEGLASRGRRVPHGQAALDKLQDKGKSPRSFRGLCSTMLCTQSAVNDKLMIAARPSSFKLPRRSTTPIIMLGAGTGIAPFRGFVQEFRAEGGKREKTILFFGCTKSSEDFVYKDELEEAQRQPSPALKELVTAFSREQEHKIYIQHRLKERSANISELLAQGAYVYVCGAVNMGKAVRVELTSMLGSADALDRLQKDGRFVEELW